MKCWMKHLTAEKHWNMCQMMRECPPKCGRKLHWWILSGKVDRADTTDRTPGSGWRRFEQTWKLLCLVHTADADKTRLSCLVRVCGVK